MVAVDGSDTGNLALNAAIQLAKQDNAVLHIVHVFDELAFSYTARYPNAGEIQKSFVDAGKEILSDAQNKAQKAGVKAETFFQQSLKGISQELADFAKAWPADVIVIGTHGRHGLERLLLGSVAEKLIRLATMPVLLVPGK